MSQADVDRMREGYWWEGYVHSVDGQNVNVPVKVWTRLGEADKDIAKEAAAITERDFNDFYSRVDGKSGVHSSSHPIYAEINESYGE